MDEETKKTIRKHVLANAVEFGKVSEKAVLGKVLAELPELRNKINDVRNEIAIVKKEVESLPKNKQKEELEKTGWKKPEKKQRAGLPDLKFTGKLVMRLAPNPNGPLHIGNARMAVLNDEYVKRYNGTLILRFDDTDPKNPEKIPMKEAYDWIQEDLKWLGVNYDRVERASARLNVYYKYFEELLKIGGAYVCSCPQEKWSNMVRRERKRCPCFSKDGQMERWKQMFSAKEGELVARIRTEFVKNPAVIDWVAFRIVDNPRHPFSDAHVWPTLDFASAIDDHDFGITYIIRGKDLAVSEQRQKILFNHFGWNYPNTTVYGRFVTTKDMIISKSKVSEGIKNGLYSGYDDPRLCFLRSFRKRGILPQAIRTYIINLGLTQSETRLDLSILYSENRRLLDPISERYFVVAEPIEIELDRLDKQTVKAPKIPGSENFREIQTSKKIFIDKRDFSDLRGENVRLMHFCNVILDRKAKVVADDLTVRKIHWVPEKNVPLTIIMPTGNKVKALAEAGIKNVRPGQTIQGERFGFMKVEKVNPLICYFAHR